jgi:hypothetical protein
MRIRMDVGGDVVDPAPGWFLVAGLLLGCILAVGLSVIWIFERRARDRRGFEVKLNTGEEPVPREEKDVE